MTARNATRAAKIREYFIANPDVKTAAVAKKFKTSYQVAYMVRHKMKPKKIVVTATEAAMAKRLGVSAVDYAKQKAKILKKAKPQSTLWQPPALLPVPDVTLEDPSIDMVNRPAHYKVGGIETIDFIEAKELDYHLGSAVKYISRANYKGNRREDLEKAKWYLNRAISQIKE
jgi:hypothetical protein